MLEEAQQQALWNALREAFPDRASALQREIARWYWTMNEHERTEWLSKLGAHEDPDAKFCSFCSRPYEEIPHFIGVSARGGAPRFSVEDLSAWGSALAVDETGNPIPSIMLICRWCLAAYADRIHEHMSGARWPNVENVLADIERAIKVAKLDAGDAISAELARRRAIVTPRTPESGTCDFCETTAEVIPTARGLICTKCLIGAFHAHKELIDRVRGE